MTSDFNQGVEIKRKIPCRGAVLQPGQAARRDRIIFALGL
jgi:hypothetical protein